MTSVPTARKTKIIATVGPSSREVDKIRELIHAGVNVFRLNFSHGSHEEHTENLTRIRAVSDELRIPVAILQDLSGPKIRITRIESDFAPLVDGAAILLRKAAGGLSSSELLFVEGLDPAEVVQPGQRILLADGIIELVVEKVSTGAVHARAVKGGRLRSKVGIAFPDSEINLPATTEKDLVDLTWGIKHEADYVALSFVQHASDMLRVRAIIDQHRGHQKLIAKIERRQAVESIREIIDASDGLMVARGDLGVEYPLEKLPIVQKQLIEECNKRGIPAIVATQMLQSMVTAIRPTRAEVTDVSLAVMSGADAVMLSEETTIGEHPVACVRWLDSISREAENALDIEAPRFNMRDQDTLTVPDAIAFAAAGAAAKVQADAIVTCTETGTSARLMAKYRPTQPIYGLSRNVHALRQMCLFRGVIPLAFGSGNSHDAEVETALLTLRAADALLSGSRVVITSGHSVRSPGGSSIVEVRTIPEQ